MVRSDGKDCAGNIMRDPIRVLHIFAPNYKHRFGGPIFDWKYAFSKWNNPEVQHFVFDPDNQRISDALEAFDFQISKQQFIPSRWERIRWVFTLQQLVNNHNKYDLIHFHVLWWAGLLMALQAERKGIPTLYQSVLLNEDTPSGIVTERLGKLKIWCLKKFTVIVPISETLTEDYLKFGFRSAQVHTLMNSVDTDLFHPVESEAKKRELRSKYALSEGVKILLFVGSVIERKGVDILIDAFIKAQSTYEDLRLVIVGASNKNENPSINEGFIHHLKTTLDVAGLRDKVIFMGLVQDHEQLTEIYQASDIFVFPSRNEGLGNVVLEAMACGLPVIVSRLPVLIKVIQDRENGYCIPLNDAEALRNALIDLIHNPQLADKISQAARIYALTNHGFTEWQSQLGIIYKGLIE